MNQEQLESLPYPMFETTEEEKECLREASPLISDEDREYFLCLVLQYRIDNSCSHNLRDKIEGVIRDHHTLSDCFDLGEYENDSIHAELRRIWIRKLLAYNPE